MPNAKLSGNFGETPVIVLGRDADEFELIALRGDYAQSAFADGTGGSEENDAAFLWSGHSVQNPSEEGCPKGWVWF